MSVSAAFDSIAEAIKLLAQAGEISMVVSLEDSARKVVLLGAASEFESSLCASVRAFARDISRNNPHITSLVEKKAISRQYHTWFDFAGRSATTFYALFGEEFKENMKALVKNDAQFSEAQSAFIEIGHLRNLLVHKDFATYPLEKTSAELHDLYLIGRQFVNQVNTEFSKIIEAAK